MDELRGLKNAAIVASPPKGIQNERVVRFRAPLVENATVCQDKGLHPNDLGPVRRVPAAARLLAGKYTGTWLRPFGGPNSIPQRSWIDGPLSRP